MEKNQSAQVPYYVERFKVVQSECFGKGGGSKAERSERKVYVNLVILISPHSRIHFLSFLLTAPAPLVCLLG